MESYVIFNYIQRGDDNVKCLENMYVYISTRKTHAHTIKMISGTTTIGGQTTFIPWMFDMVTYGLYGNLRRYFSLCIMFGIWMAYERL